MRDNNNATGLVGIGDNVVDYYCDSQQYYPGGNTLNVAILARRFGLKNTAYIGILGSDWEGQHVLTSLVTEGLSDSYLRFAIGPNGKAQVTHDQTGDRIFVDSNRGGIRRKLMLRMDDDDLELISEKGHVHTSCHSYIEPEIPRIRAAARSLSFDFSTERDPAYFSLVCPYVSTAFFSGADLDDSRIDDLILEIQALGTPTVCITRGEAGAIWACGSKRLKQASAPAKIIDTMGAGDAFIGAYLAATINGDIPEIALSHAADFASKACQWRGSWGYGRAKK
jgi:fructoselysine 6-kinase